MDKMLKLEQEISKLYLKVRNCKDVNDAEEAIKRLMKINEEVCQMIFIDKSAVTDKLWRFFKDFDLSYDDQMYDYFFKKIKTGEYGF